MIIAYDAKRAYHNRRGLGNYSRDLVRLMTEYAPENKYFLLNPSANKSINLPYEDSITQIMPRKLWKLVPALWRSYGCISDLKHLQPTIYHGLSGELPYGIENVDCIKIVTIHDAIFMRYPQQYSATYRKMFLHKCQYACQVADVIIAISEQTKRDCITYFNADEKKIKVIYQGCNNQFRQTISEDDRLAVIQKYGLPTDFILYVGAIEPNKNLDNLIRAMHEAELDLPLVIMSMPSRYADQILASAKQLNVSIDIHYDIPFSDFPAIYQQAKAFCLLSFFEGFGIPVLEAVCSHTPVLASNSSCLEETGGKAALYADPTDVDDIASQLNKIVNNNATRRMLNKASIGQAELFTDQTIANNLIDLYEKC